MTAMRRIRWGRIVVAGLLAEAGVFAMFFVLLFDATLAGDRSHASFLRAQL
jgi:hypothetical protein